MSKIEIKNESSYFATVCRLTGVRKHPNADKMLLANALGYQVIVGLDAKDGDLVVLFPSDGKLSKEMLLENKLYRKHPDTGIEMGGYFESSGRVKAIRLRKASSEAFVTSVSSLEWTGVSDLSEGDTFTHLNGKEVCGKYYTPATLRAMNRQKNQPVKKKKPQDYALELTRHFSTTKLRHAINDVIGTETEFVVTEKLHGTSGRTGLVKWTDRKWWQTALNWIGLYQDKYRYISGTRKVVYDPDAIQNPEKGFYEGSTFRRDIHNSIASTGLKEGEVLYYEIVGYTGVEGSPIMGYHFLEELKDSGVPKKEYSKYGEFVMYSYGCEQSKTHVPHTITTDDGVSAHVLKPASPYKVYIYRVVQDGADLSWNEVKLRCNELKLEHVPELGTIKLNGSESASDIMHMANEYSLGDSTLDSRHFKEGVCLRVDHESGIRVYKYKGELFCILEGIMKNDPDYVDQEEIS